MTAWSGPARNLLVCIGERSPYLTDNFIDTMTVDDNEIKSFSNENMFLSRKPVANKSCENVAV